MLFRLGAVSVGLTPLLLAEVTFTALDWGRPGYGDDPFVDFSAVRPLFVRSEDGTRREIAPSRQVFFCPDSFAARKGKREFRIFCLGGSTVQGRPFSIETSFTTWLKFNLNAADPTRRWEVVNCGGISYASYRLVPILEEVLAYEPDLIILYTGHNEFLEDRTYGHVKHWPTALARPCRWVAATRTFTLVRRGCSRLSGQSDRDVPEGRPTLGPETNAILEYRDGLAQYHRDNRWRRDVIEHFRFNLRRMVGLTRDAGVPLLLMNPVCNLRDCAPFKTQHRDGLTPRELARWEALIGRAGRLQATKLPRAVELLEQVLAIDDQHAGLHHILAACYDGMGMLVEARESYLRAKELDVCPLRILEPMHEAILEAARRTDTPLVDVRRQFERLSSVGIPGGFYLIDHVHPSVAGHRLIADALTDTLIRQGVVRPVSDWKQKVDQQAERHLKSLEAQAYFDRGQEHLEALRLWTQGKADKVRPTKSPVNIPW